MQKFKILVIKGFKRKFLASIGFKIKELISCNISLEKKKKIIWENLLAEWISLYK